MLMGTCTRIIKLPRIPDYWYTKNYLLHELLKCLSAQLLPTNSQVHVLPCVWPCLGIPRGQEEYDKLGDVQCMIALSVRPVWGEHTLHCQVTINEAMIPFKGRLGYKQYMNANQPSGYQGLCTAWCQHWVCVTIQGIKGSWCGRCCSSSCTVHTTGTGLARGAAWAWTASLHRQLLQELYSALSQNKYIYIWHLPNVQKVFTTRACSQKSHWECCLERLLPASFNREDSACNVRWVVCTFQFTHSYCHLGKGKTVGFLSVQLHHQSLDNFVLLR